MAQPRRRLYGVSRALARLGIRVFYRRVVAHTLEHVPPRGPVIFAATHPNSITDPLLLGACVPREIRYVAHSGLFRHPMLAWIMDRCGVIPVHRPEDFPGQVDNSRMFGRCREALLGGGAIGIFPEGTSHQEARLRRLRTGTARIALDAESAAAFTAGVLIVPVGLDFQSPGRFRSDVVVLIGPPLELHPWRRTYAADPARAIEEVTAELGRRLERLVAEPPPPDVAPFVGRTVRLLRESSAGGASGPLDRRAAARRAAEALAWAAHERPGDYGAYARRLQSHTRARRRLGLPEAALAPPEAGAGPPGALAMLAAPLALAGAAAHAVPYRATAWVTRRLRPHPSKLATVKFCAGVAFFSLWYAAGAGAAWALWSPAAGLLALAALSLAGWLALRWLPAWQALRSRAAGRSVPSAAREEVERLRAERRQLAAEARGFWDACSAARAW